MMDKNQIDTVFDVVMIISALTLWFAPDVDSEVGYYQYMKFVTLMILINVIDIRRNLRKK